MMTSPKRSSESCSDLAAVLPEPQAAQTAKAVQVQRMFDRISARYDCLNDWISLGMHRRWKRFACAALQLQPGMRALDVCTGTGDLAGLLLSAVGETGQVDGLDFSPDMLTVARQRFADDARIRFVQGDALALPYPDDTFDGVTISFGLRNVTNIPQALSEMRRVLKPGGRLVNLDTCPAPRWSPQHLYMTYIVPRFGALLAGDAAAYDYLSRSTAHFLTPPQLKTMFESIGFQRVQTRSFLFGAASLQVGEKG